MMKKTEKGINIDCEKSKKYDRQLRLWGDLGQFKIEVSNICLINANALGTEILKNLVLPGIGFFTIIDSSKVTTEDDNNFFINKDSYGQSRAKVCTELLQEMNDDVRGDYIEDSIENLLETSSSLFLNFTVVIVSNLYNEKNLSFLSKLLWDHNIPLLVCYSIGFIGLIHLQIKEHFVIESHPDYILEDLRLDKPFPELKKFLEENLNFDVLSKKELSHIPYLVIIYKYLKKWRLINNLNETCIPSNYKEKTELKKLIEEGLNYYKQKHFNETDNNFNFENFDEALKAVNQVLVSSNYIPEETQNILNFEEKIKTNLNRAYWLLIQSLKEFIKKNDGCLPLKGRLPDMTSDSLRYVQLQKLFKNKAKEDCETIYTIIQNLFNEENEKLEEISESLVRSFCSNTHCLRLVCTSSLFEEYEQESFTLAKIRGKINSSCMVGDCESNELIYYLMIRSLCKFYMEFNRLPGSDQVESDIVALKNCFRSLLKEIGCNRLSKDDYIHEICRYGGCELHSVSSFLAGTIAQEVIKLITNQYVPLNSMLIYNAISSTTATFHF